jgi:Sap, sulfolipid-1-addressing protein
VWFTVVLMAVIAAIEPLGIAVLVVILSTPQPVRHLMGYLVGGFGASLVLGGVTLFVLDGVGGHSRRGLPAGIQIAVGVLALVLAAFVGSGIAERVRAQRQARRGGAGAGTAPATAAAQVPRGVEQLAAFQRLPGPVQKALGSESAWVAWVAGVLRGSLPNANYLAAIAAILGAGAGVATSVAALVVFNTVAFVLPAVFLVRFLVAPDATREHVDRLYLWTNTHRRLVVTVLAAVVGVYLLIMGVSKL